MSRRSRLSTAEVNGVASTPFLARLRAAAWRLLMASSVLVSDCSAFSMAVEIAMEMVVGRVDGLDGWRERDARGC